MTKDLVTNAWDQSVVNLQLVDSSSGFRRFFELPEIAASERRTKVDGTLARQLQASRRDEAIE
jgi:hypothetical protein